jgi:hypothetical protein
VVNSPSCNHVTGMHAHQLQCGRMHCNSLQCDECYEGHVFEAHFFANVPDDEWRDVPSLYIPSVVKRAQRGKELCYGHTTPPRTLGFREGK